MGVRTAAAATLLAPPDPALAAIKTWRYLRLAMVLLVAGLATSVLYERFRVPADCWQPSVSAYYYTPARAFLVGTLVTIGVCLVALKGSTAGEDLLLNIAGFCAPFVALVPEPHAGACGSVLVGTAQRDLSVANNVVALLVVAGLALLVAVGLALAARPRGHARVTRLELIGLGLSIVLLVLATVVFATARAWFTAHAHHVAAATMFGFVFLDVCLNAVHLARSGPRQPRRAPNRYAWLTVGMAGWAGVHLGLWAAGWPLWVLTLEAGLITLFAVFWLLQTVELWNRGLRPPAVARPRRVSNVT